MQVEGPERIGDRDAYIVVGKRDGKTPIRLYFDEQSGFLLRLVRFGDSALGWLPTQIDYADYRDSNGVKIPYRWTLARPSGRFTIQVSEVKQNIPVDDARFAKPATEQKVPGCNAGLSSTDARPEAGPRWMLRVRVVDAAFVTTASASILTSTSAPSSRRTLRPC